MQDASNALTSQTNVSFAFNTHIEIGLKIKRAYNAGCVLRFKRKRKIANAKIYEDKHDLYCICQYYVILFVFVTGWSCSQEFLVTCM